MDSDVQAASAVVLDSLMARQLTVSAAVQRALASDIAELRGDAELLQLLGASVAGNVETIFHALRHDISLDNISPPTAALEYARRLAQQGVPMHALVRAYRLGHALVIDAAAEEVAATGQEARIGLAVFERITTVSFRYIDWISQQVVEVYEDERERWLANQNSARALRVREVLTAPSVPSDPDAVSAALRYPLHAVHLALVLWWPADTAPEDGLGRLELVLRDLAEVVAAQSSPLFVAADRDSGWGWIPLATAHAADAVGRVRDQLRSSSDPPAVALGIPLRGVDGFRSSHRLAVRARSVLAATGAGGIVAAGDPGLAAATLLGRNLDEAREFVVDALGGLAGDTDGDARLRETLRVYLAAGGSYKSAGEQLNLHFNSVKYRVGRAVARRGRGIDDDRLDVELALLLCRHYGSAVLASPGG